MVDKVKQGKKNRASGADFERRVRKDLENKGWIVDKWSNNVELGNCKNCSYKNEEHFEDGQCPILGQEKQYLKKDGRLIPSKHKFRGQGIPMAMGTGFPDFIAFRFIKEEREVLSSKGKFYPIIKETESVSRIKLLYENIGVESKINGQLDKLEKEKCAWLIKNNKFSKILIASKIKVKNKIVIKYEDFTEKYG